MSFCASFQVGFCENNIFGSYQFLRQSAARVPQFVKITYEVINFFAKVEVLCSPLFKVMCVHEKRK